MSKICVSCGMENKDNDNFCQNCGANLNVDSDVQNTDADVSQPVQEIYPQFSSQPVSEPQPEPVSPQPMPQPTPQPAPQQTYQQSAPAPQPAVVQQTFISAEGMEKPDSLGKCMLIQLLLMIPLVGIVVYIILLCGVFGNKSITNYIRASFIWGLIITAVTVVLVVITGASLFAYLQNLTDQIQTMA